MSIKITNIITFVVLSLGPHTYDKIEAFLVDMFCMQRKLGAESRALAFNRPYKRGGFSL